MKNITLQAAVSMLAAAFVSCSKETPLQENGQEPAGTISVSVNGLLGEYVQGDDTKAGLVSTTRISWGSGDKVYVYDGASCLGELTVSLKDGKDSYAILAGENIAVPQSGTTKLTLVYSNSFESAPAISGGKVSLDMSNQTGVTSPNNLPFVAYATLDYSSGTPEISGEIVDFLLATSLMRLNCSGLTPSTSITGATLKGMGSECVLDITKDGVVVGQGIVGSISLAFSDISSSANGTQTIFAALASNSTAADQTLEIKQNATKYTYGFGSKSRAAGKAFNVVSPLKEKSLPEGALPGIFSVSASKKVNFSKGNLQATFQGGDATNYSWGFAKNQYDYIGNAAGNTTIGSQTAGAVVDLFGWSTSSTYYGINTSTDNAKYSGDFVDWGGLIGDGSTWRTLSKDEWVYLFNTRTVNGGTGEGKSYSKNITHGGKMGLVLYPDDYTGSVLSGTVATLPDGVVFLPAVGSRHGSSLINAGSYGYYLSSTLYGSTLAYSLLFGGSNVYPSYTNYRYYGQSVRLVTESL